LIDQLLLHLLERNSIRPVQFLRTIEEFLKESKYIMKLVKLLLSIEDVFFTTKHTKSKIAEWKTESFERE
jgi:hypothetical protein